MLSVSIIGAQTKLIQPIDSNWAKIHIEELKYITAQFIELDFQKSQNNLLKQETGILKRTITDKDTLISIKNNEITDYKKMLKETKPAWYDKFWIGVATAVAAVIGIKLAVQ